MVETLTEVPVDLSGLRAILESSRQFFARSTDVLTDEHSDFAPAEGLMTAVNQVAHVAHTLDWFAEGMQSPEGFDMDFEAHLEKIMAVTSLTEARAWVDRAFDAFLQLLDEKDAAFWSTPMAEGPVMGGQPRQSVIGAIADHTAHHRGVLTVYSRLQGLVPNMPYM